MKILALAILAATINASAQTCPAAVQEEAALARIKATPIDSEATREKIDGWIKYHEQKIEQAVANCKNPPEELAADRAAEVMAIRAKNNQLLALAKAAAEVGAEAAAAARSNLWRTDPGRLAEPADLISAQTKRLIMSAKGAAQVTQLASELQIDYSQLLVRQNDEIIRLLRIMAKEKK